MGIKVFLSDIVIGISVGNKVLADLCVYFNLLRSANDKLQILFKIAA